MAGGDGGLSEVRSQNHGSEEGDRRPGLLQIFRLSISLSLFESDCLRFCLLSLS